MLEFLTNKKHIAAFATGCGFIITIFSTLIMDPSDMWRWLINGSSKDVKVERALTAPFETVLRLKAEVAQLSIKLVEQQENAMTSLRSYIEENKELKKTIRELNISVSERKRDVEINNNKIAQLTTELSGHQKKLSQIEAENSMLRSSSIGNAIEPIKRSEFILDNATFVQGRPVLFYKGKLSVMAATCYYDKSFIRIVHFFSERKANEFWLNKGSPATIDVNGTKYIIHLLDGSTNSKSVISTFVSK